MSISRQKLGARGEEAAARLLLSKRYAILARNWRAGRLELDLVCADGRDLVFVEVKTRTEGTLTQPADGMTHRKKRNLVKAARVWLSAHGARERACRFDVVCVTDCGQGLKLEHHQNAFSLSDLVDSGNAVGQPG